MDPITENVIMTTNEVGGYEPTFKQRFAIYLRNLINRGEDCFEQVTADISSARAELAVDKWYWLAAFVLLCLVPLIPTLFGR